MCSQTAWERIWHLLALLICALVSPFAKQKMIVPMLQVVVKNKIILRTVPGAEHTQNTY